MAEGIRMVSEVPKDRLVQIFCSEGAALRFEQEKADLPGEPIILADHVFRKVSDTQTPQGILAVVRQEAHTVSELLSGDEAQLLFLENLQNPGNLGTLLRTGEAAGFTGVILSRDSVDRYNPKAIRGSMGSVFRMPVAYAEDFLQAIEEGRRNGVSFFAAHLEGSTPYDLVEYPKKTALLIGNEGNGLSEAVTACADTRIRIPMEGCVESLNAAVAASVLMYEVHRQKKRTAES